MKRIIITQLVILLAFVAFSGKVFSQATDKPANDKVKIITDLDFDKTIKKGITLIDFWAVWCGPCRRQAPIVEEIANEVSKKITIGKLDVDKNKIASSTYSVRNIPTLIIFKDGKEVKRMVGLQNKEAILAALKEIK